ncbi:cocaine- and amphetamine-regulated transcript protein-like [Micropterus salmoides]|uniref:cocaine- and amphetamine-regulated transcript protein-like n=1 Tax=Micropterus salmoides TaxID=27706 RepID=UPI0018EAA34B|nr:cocaine- and amphetamine-regulated transcript protein-like [Micropterus salmoides]XP_038557384.1 cocaine- and amphetamine-regulated transcript protein-like [Micropterus salmoides]
MYVEGGISCGPAATLCSSSPDLLAPVGTSPTETSTMDSSRMLRVLLLVGLLSVMCHGQASQEVSAEDFGVDKPEPAAERDLIEALEALLGRMHNRISSTEKRGSIPLCGMGDRCAMKFGPRIGKLCDCGRGANCNSYLLKCI